MKYIKKYENFKPITINSAKPFKVKNGLLKNAVYLQKGIKSDRKRLGREKDPAKRTKLNNDKNSKIQKLRSVNFKTLKQAEYLRNNPVKESYTDEDDNKQNLIDVLESPDFKPENIVNYIGLDKGDYDIEMLTNYRGQDPEYYDDKLKLFMKSHDLDDLIDKQEGTIHYILELDNYYNNYSFDVDDSELNYLETYLPEETTTKIKEFAKLFNYDLTLDDNDIKNGETRKMFDNLGLEKDLNDFKTEISNENTRAVERLASHIIKSLPLNLSFEHVKNFDIELEIKYDDIINYMKEKNIEVYSIKELLENISEFEEFSYEIEYNDDKSDYMDEHKDLINAVNNVVDDYLISPDYLFPKIIAVDNLEVFRNNFDKAEFNSIYDFHVKYDKKRMDLFNIARFYKGEILQWFVSPEFEERLKEEKSDEEFENYEQFIYKANAAKFNI